MKKMERENARTGVRARNGSDILGEDSRVKGRDCEKEREMQRESTKKTRRIRSRQLENKYYKHTTSE